MMDLHSFNLVSTATSLLRQVAAVCHSSDRKSGDGIFKIRARNGLKRPKGGSCRHFVVKYLFIFNLCETILNFFTGT